MTGTLNARLRSKDKLVLNDRHYLPASLAIRGGRTRSTQTQAHRSKDTQTLEIKLQNNQNISASDESVAYDQAFNEAQQAEQVARYRKGSRFGPQLFTVKRFSAC